MSQIIIVDEEDKVIGFKDRDEIKSSDIYRASALLVTSPGGKILIARRSQNKSNDPGKWGPSVAGTVEQGETYESNIIKEAEEELGLKYIVPVFWFKKRVEGKHNHFSCWFKSEVGEDVALMLDPAEVAEAKWVTREELLRMAMEFPEEFIDSFRKWIINSSEKEIS